MSADFRSVESTLNRYVEGLDDERSPDTDYARSQAKALIGQYHRPENRTGFDNPGGKALAALVARVHGDTPVRARQLLTRLGLKGADLESAVEEFAHLERPADMADRKPSEVASRLAAVAVGRLKDRQNEAESLGRNLTRVNAVLDVLDPVLRYGTQAKLAAELARELSGAGEVEIADRALRRISARPGEFLAGDVKLAEWEGHLMKKVRELAERRTPEAARAGAASVLGDAEVANYF
jgi:hypothetical protein